MVDHKIKKCLYQDPLSVGMRGTKKIDDLSKEETNYFRDILRDFADNAYI